MISQIKFIQNSQMQDTVSRALVTDPRPLLSNIVRGCLSEGQTVDLALDDQFMIVRYSARQIVRLFEFTSTQLHMAPSARAVARAFEVSHTVVAHTGLRDYNDPPARGRHRELSADCEQELVEWLANKAANCRVVNRMEFLHERTEGFGKSITGGWVNSFITRHAHKLFETKVFPKKVRSSKCLEFSLKR
jgi:hypothetical protein